MPVSAARFVPKRAFIDEAALEYPLGKEISERLRHADVPVRVLKRGQHPDIPGSNPSQSYVEAKNSLVVRVRTTKGFESCKPSAHYQIPLATSCPGLCEYCYLQTRLGPKPYVRVYANIGEIFAEAGRLIEDREPEVTVFEGAATSDPMAVEWITGSLKATIEFFGGTEHGKFRFVTKFADVDPILDASHQGRTTVRFSVNAAYVIETFEHRTSDLEARLEALGKVSKAGYPIGVMIGPIIIFDGWKEQYGTLLEGVGKALELSPDEDSAREPARLTEAVSSGFASSTDFSEPGIPFELITHRFTARAKNNILSVFPNTRLPMEESERRLAFGQFGYTKHVYPQDMMKEVEEFFGENIPRYVKGGRIQYLV